MWRYGSILYIAIQCPLQQPSVISMRLNPNHNLTLIQHCLIDDVIVIFSKPLLHPVDSCSCVTFCEDSPAILAPETI